jgi:uncharacterized protein (PEP-CTERM system associated)
MVNTVRRPPHSEGRPGRGALAWAGRCAAFWAALAAAAPALADPPPFPGTEAPDWPGPTSNAPSTEGESSGSLSPPPVRLGTLGFPFGAPTPEPGSAGRSWNIVPSLAVQLIGTDNVNQTSRGQRSDLITSIIPGIFATADTSRLRGTLSYSPIAQIYASESDQNRIAHIYNAQALATLIPQTLYFDLRGAGAVQATSGGSSPQGGLVTDRRNQVQTTSVQASPYYIHRFGGLATVQIGYAFQHVSQNGNNQSLPQGGAPFFTAQEFTAHEGYAVVRTGEDFGPLAFQGRVSGTFYSGTGVLDNAHRHIASLEARYAIMRGVAALVEGGYEDQRYAGVPPLRIQEPIWAVGVRLTPGPESLIIVKYGRRDGFDSFYLDASVGLGGRTRLTANYSDRLATSALRAADLLSTTSLDELGNPVDTLTGAPTLQSFANSFLGVQSSLLRIKRATAAITQTWPRNSLTLSVFHEDQRPVAIAPGTTGFAQEGIYGALSWSHSLAPVTNLFGYLQYGRFDSPTAGSGDLFSANAGLTHQINPKLSAILQYLLIARGSNSTNGRVTQNIILVGLRQTF